MPNDWEILENKEKLMAKLEIVDKLLSIKLKIAKLRNLHCEENSYFIEDDDKEKLKNIDSSVSRMLKEEELAQDNLFEEVSVPIKVVKKK
jgi:hypothetical protein